MKITQLETFLVKPRWLFLKVHTDEGLVGLGEPILEGRALTCAQAVDELAPYLIGEALPGKTIQSDEEWEHYLRHAGWPGAHAVGSCSMGSDANPAASALDAQLRVRGVAGLRVADASVMPSLPSGNTNAPVIAVAEKAADLIRASQP